MARRAGAPHAAIVDHRAADRTYFDEGIRLLELARRARELFEKQDASEKRRLLDFVLSNSVWKDGELAVTFRQPFDLRAVTTAAQAAGDEPVMAGSGLSEEWLPEANGFANSGP